MVGWKILVQLGSWNWWRGPPALKCNITIKGILMTSDTAQQFSTSLLPILPSSYVQMRSIVTTIFGSSDKRPFSSFHASKHQGTVEHQRSKQGSPLCATCHGFILPLISGSLPTFKSVPYGTLEGLKDRSASTICGLCVTRRHYHTPTGPRICATCRCSLIFWFLAHFATAVSRYWRVFFWSLLCWTRVGCGAVCYEALLAEASRLPSLWRPIQRTVHLAQPHPRVGASLQGNAHRDVQRLFERFWQQI